MAFSDPSTASHDVREPRTVRADRAFVWYAEAMRLFKRHPARFGGLALAIVVVELLLDLVPVVGRPTGNVVVPLLACSLLYASLAIDRGDPPRWVHLVAPFAAPVASLAAILLASFAVFAVEWLVAWHVTGVNLLSAADKQSLSPLAIFAIYGAGVAVSLPLTLVPLLALFEQASLRDAFAGSLAAFLRNVPAFSLYGALSIALLGFAFITYGLGLLIALPLWAASSYIAWKQLFGIEG
jgi:uncharacterized membrane protein